MNVMSRISVNLVTASLLGIVLHVAHRRLDHEDMFNRLFLYACGGVLTLLILESLTCILNGEPALWLRWIAKASHVVLFSLPPALTYYWFLFAKVVASNDDTRVLRINKGYLVPIAINFVVAILSPFFNWTFCIDEGGVYHRGPFFLPCAAISYSYLLMGVVYLAKNREKVPKDEFSILFLLSLMPMLGGLYQGLVYGPLTMWGSTACALVAMYLYMQERMIHTDSLTGAWARGSFESSLMRMMRQDSGEPFGMVYIDIDDFKAINDRFGHVEGDAALKTLVSIVKPHLRKTDAIARLGGDEFAIFVRVAGPESLQTVVKKVEKALEEYGHVSEKPYRIQCSIGAEMFRLTSDTDVRSVIQSVDRLMYDRKRGKAQPPQPDA